MKYVYPAIFTQEENGYSVSFPDIENCFTSGETLVEAYEMAQDALSLMLWDMEDDKKEIASPSPISSMALQNGQFASLVCADTDEYRRKMDNRAVKKTLTIPSWLNSQAERANINFSQLLQSALKQELHIAE